MQCWQKWQDAKVMLKKKQETAAELHVASKSENLWQAEVEINETN